MTRALMTAAALLTWGCITGSNEGAVDGGAGEACTPGRTVSCACDDGATGVATCQPNGVFEACACGQPPDDDGGAGGGDGGRLPTDAGPRDDAALATDGEPPIACEDGTEETRPCGQGGEQTRVCAATTWGPWGVCAGECEDGARQRRPCGVNGRGEESRACEDTAWTPWTGCADPDVCADDSEETGACGLNGRGARTRACAEGQWGAWSACEDPDACVDGATRPRLCGRNENGVAQDVCAVGAWTEVECDDPDVCDAGADESRACGVGGAGTQTRGCMDGQWSAWGPCDDPTRECEDRSIEEVPCGLNRRGRQSHTCEGGAWGEWTACEDPDACVDGATRSRPCGVAGVERQTCREGAWGDFGACDDAAVCEDGAEERAACGLNGRGSQDRACAGGFWGAFGPCDDPDVCVDLEQQVEACDGGERGRACIGGAWTDWSECMRGEMCPDGSAPPCEMGGNVCPEPRVAEAEIHALPLDVVTLDGRGSVDEDGPNGGPVAWSWVVISRPDGSTAQPVERFFNPARPADGGPEDAADTPEAQFFVDLAGVYEIELRVTDAGGLTAPSEACPARGARVRIVATPNEDLHVQLVWHTPGDGDETDQEGSDVDIHLLHPEGRAFSVAPYDCYFANIEPDWGPNGEAGNPSLDIDDVNGAGPENINLDGPEDTAQFGTGYRVGVHYYRAENFLMGGVWGPSMATVRIFARGVMAGEFERELAATDHFWTVASIHWEDGAARVEPINDYVATGPPMNVP